MGLVCVYPMNMNMMPAIIMFMRTIADRAIHDEDDDDVSFASVSLPCLMVIVLKMRTIPGIVVFIMCRSSSIRTVFLFLHADCWRHNSNHNKQLVTATRVWLRPCRPIVDALAFSVAAGAGASVCYFSLMTVGG